jgi:membrane protein YqaA with SNARE-associated domain
MSAVGIILSYALIVGSITLFFTPFYWLYTRQHPDTDKQRPGFSLRIEHFFGSRQANYLVFFWALGEAVVWFVIPEFLLLLVIFMRIKRKRELLYYDIYGTAAGTLIALLIHLPHSAIDKLPYIQPGMIAQVQAWYAQHGVFGLLFQPFSGVPYKVFTHLAGDYHFFIPLFLLVAIAARISRYFFFYVFFATIYPVLHKYVYRNYFKLVLIAIFIFTLLLLRVNQVYGPGYEVKGQTFSTPQNTLKQKVK